MTISMDQWLPWVIFEGFVHRLFLKSMCWFQGVYELTKVLLRNYPKIGHVSVELIASMSWRRRLCDHSCLPSRHHPNEESWKDSRLIKTKSRVNQLDQLTKRRRCTGRDQAIPWCGKHCQLHFVYSPMIFVRVLCGVRLRCASSSEASWRDQMLEACRPLWWQWTCEDVQKSGSPIMEYGGAIN